MSKSIGSKGGGEPESFFPMKNMYALDWQSLNIYWAAQGLYIFVFASGFSQLLSR